MQHNDDVRSLHNVLVGLSLHDRLAALAVSIIADDPRAPVAVSNLIAVATMMARHLPIEQRTAVIWHLNNAAEELRARWN